MLQRISPRTGQRWYGNKMDSDIGDDGHFEVNLKMAGAAVNPPIIP